MRAGGRFDPARFLLWLEREKVRYLVIGGHAVRMYGSERLTYDFDFWFSTDERKRVLQYLETEFDLELSADPDDHQRPIVTAVSELDKVDTFFVAGMSTPEGGHLDFDDIYGRSRLRDSGDGHAARVPAPEDLLRMKRLRPTPKLRDEQDIQFLQVLIHVERSRQPG